MKPWRVWPKPGSWKEMFELEKESVKLCGRVIILRVRNGTRKEMRRKWLQTIPLKCSKIPILQKSSGQHYEPSKETHMQLFQYAQGKFLQSCFFHFFSQFTNMATVMHGKLLQVCQMYTTENAIWQVTRAPISPMHNWIYCKIRCWRNEAVGANAQFFIFVFFLHVKNIYLVEKPLPYIFSRSLCCSSCLWFSV